MKTVYLHIGPHKTGTTYIQKKLAEHQGLLKSNNILYQTNKEDAAHHNIAEFLLRNKFKLAKEEINNILSHDFTNFILSSENFDRLNSVQLKELSEILTDVTVKIIYFNRNISDLLLSVWQESIKHGACEDWFKYFSNSISKPYKNPYLNKKLVLDNYSNIFGKENIIIIDYDQLLLEKKNIFSFLFEKISNKKISTSNELINKSFNMFQIEIIRNLNNIFYQKYGFFGMHFLRDSLLKLLANNQEVNNLNTILLQKVKKTKIEIELNNIFLFNMFTESLKKDYADRFITKIYDKEKSKSFILPDSNWIINKESIDILLKIFEQVEKDTALQKHIQINQKMKSL